VKAIVLTDGVEVPYEEFLRESGRQYYDPSDPESRIWRRLLPEELEELNGFRRGWTRMELDGIGPVLDTRRAFLMGNALVVGVVRALGKTLMDDWQG
jgi:hypothetical protein